MCMFSLEHKTPLLPLNAEASLHINLIPTALISRLNSPFQLSTAMSQSTRGKKINQKIKIYVLSLQVKLIQYLCFVSNNCNFKGTPYINHCNYNQAYISLSHLFGENLKEAVTAKPENLIEFNQSKFFDSAMSSMADSAYIYVPTACKDLKTKCRLHISKLKNI